MPTIDVEGVEAMFQSTRPRGGATSAFGAHSGMDEEDDTEDSGMKVRIGNYILNVPGGRITNKADDKDTICTMPLKKKMPKTKWPKYHMEMMK